MESPALLQRQASKAELDLLGSDANAIGPMRRRLAFAQARGMTASSLAVQAATQSVKTVSTNAKRKQVEEETSSQSDEEDEHIREWLEKTPVKIILPSGKPGIESVLVLQLNPAGSDRYVNVQVKEMQRRRRRRLLQRDMDLKKASWATMVAQAAADEDPEVAAENARRVGEAVAAVAAGRATAEQALLAQGVWGDVDSDLLLSEDLSSALEKWHGDAAGEIDSKKTKKKRPVRRPHIPVASKKKQEGPTSSTMASSQSTPAVEPSRLIGISDMYSKSGALAVSKWMSRKKTGITNVEMLKALIKSAERRTDEHIHQLERLIRPFVAFSKYSDKFKRELCRIMVYAQYDTGETLFSQGDIGEKWYIILSGSVNVLVAKEGQSPEQGSPVALLKAGQAFGEKALTSGNKRNASIRTAEVSEFLTVSRGDFRRLMNMRKPTHPKRLIKALQLESYQRSKKDIAVIVQYTQKLEAFKKFSRFMQTELCRVFIYEKMTAGQVLFQEGDVGRCWYVILAGAVNIIKYHPEDGSRKAGKPVVVRVFETGTSFGEIALSKDVPRQATVACAVDTEFLKVERDDYKKLLKFVHQRDLEDNVGFLHQFAVFRKWEQDRLTQLSDVLQFEEKKKGEVIVHEGDDAANLVLIRSGDCHVFKHVLLPCNREDVRVRRAAVNALFKGKQTQIPDTQASSTGWVGGEDQLIVHHLKIATLTTGHFFGVDALIGNGKYGATLKAASDVKVALLDRLKFKEGIPEPTKKAMLQLSVPIPPDDEAEEQLMEQKERKQWSSYRNRLMKTILQEKEARGQFTKMFPAQKKERDGRPAWK